MAEIIVTDRAGNIHRLQGETGRSVMENLRDNGFEIQALCGGCCSCATCHCYIDPDFLARLPGPDDCERDLLEFADESQENSRLTCQIPFSEALDGLRLTIAPED